MPRFNRARTVRRNNAEAIVDLRKRRIWYSDDSGDDPPNKTGQDAPPDEFDFDGLPDNVKQHIRGLRSEAKGHRLDKRDLEQKLADTEGKMTDLETSRKTELEREGNYEQLNRQQEQELVGLRLKAEKAERLEKSVIARNEVMLKKLPEHMQDLYPADLSPEQQSEWLDKAVPKLTAQPIPNLDGGAGGQGRSGGSTVKLSSEEKILAARMRMTDDEYKAARDK